MDVKIAFLNDILDESIYMVQLEEFVKKSQEQKVCLWQRSIYGLKQVSRLSDIKFDQAIKFYGYDQVLYELCVYKKIKDDKFMVLYIEDILLIWNDICYVNYKNMACKTI